MFSDELAQASELVLEAYKKYSNKNINDEINKLIASEVENIKPLSKSEGEIFYIEVPARDVGRSKYLKFIAEKLNKEN